MNACKFVLAAFLLVVGVVQAPVPAQEVAKTLPIQVQDPGMATRTDWPVTGGVPFARGDLVGKNVRLVDADGKAVPLQTEVLARWPDGSTKWLLLDFNTTMAKAGQTKYMLHYGATEAGPALEHPLRVDETDEEVRIDTGVIQLAIPRKPGGFLRQVWRDGRTLLARPADLTVVNELTGAIPYNDQNYVIPADGKLPRVRYQASLDTTYRKVVVEEKGALRAVVNISGRHTAADGKRFIPYDLRITAYRGKDWIKLAHTFIYDGEPERDFLKEMTIDLALAGDDPVQVSSACGKAVPLPPNQTASLLAIGPEKVFHHQPPTLDKAVEDTFTAAGKSLGSGKDGLGWMSVARGTSRLTAAVRDWHLLSPKEMLAEGNGMLHVCLWPQSGARKLDLRKRISPKDWEIQDKLEREKTLKNNWSEFHNDRLDSARGLAKTHDVFLQFGAAPEEDAIRAFNAPLLPFVSGDYNGRTGVNGPFGGRRPERYPIYEATQDFMMRWLMTAQRVYRWDGMLTYGGTLIDFDSPNGYGGRVPLTWNCYGYSGWTCNDGQWCRAFILQYLRTGRPDYWRFAEAEVRHIMDVNTVHWEEPLKTSGSRLGGGHRHNQKVWGDRLCGYGTASNGAGDYYCLTGDRRALDVLREYVHFHKYGGGSEDEDQLAAIVGLWDITGETELIDWARRGFVKPYLAAKDPRAFWSGLRRDYMMLGLLRYYWATEDKEVGTYLAQVARTGAFDSRHGLFYGAAGTLLGKTDEARSILLRCTTGPKNNDILWQETPRSVEQMTLERMMQIAPRFRMYTMPQLQRLPHFIHALEQAGVSQEALVQERERRK